MAVILRKQPNGAIPDDVVSKLAKEFGKSWGATYVEGGELQVGRGEDISQEMIQETQTNLLEDNAVFFFSNEKVEQPFDLFTTVVEVDGENVEVPLLTMYLEGNFKVRLRDGTEHTQHATIAAQVAKKVKLYMTAHEDDVSKVMEELRENEGDLLNMIVDRGVIVIVASDGDVVSIEKGNTLAGSFDWGWMSNSIGFQAAPQTQGTAGKVKGMFDKARSKLSGGRGTATVPPVAPPAPAEKTVVHATPPTPPAEKTQTAVPASAGVPKDTATEYVWWRPVPGMSRSQKKDKYKALGHTLTGLDWKGNKPVMVPIAMKEKFKSGFGGEWLTQEQMTLVLKEQFSGVKQPTAEDEGDDEDASDVNTEEVNDQVQDKQVTAEILPILNPKTLDYIIKGEVLKTLDTHSVETPDATTLGQMEKKYPPVMKQLGKKPDAWLKWEYTGIRDLNAAHPDVLPILICDARLAMWRQAQTIKDLTAQVEKLKAGGSKTLPEGVHEVRQPAPTAQQKHKHKFGQGFKKTA